VTQDFDFSSFLSQSPSLNAGGKIKLSRGTAPGCPSYNSQPTNIKISPPLNPTNGESSSSSSPLQQQPAFFVPKPIADVVNPAGTHIHNHLKFFTSNRKDAYGHPVGHSNYSPRTLYVDFHELARIDGKISPAQQQWWEIKSQYADTVLLFKVGKFYEMFHDDADVGVSVLGFVYMKGVSAHAGFPESAYGTMVSRLVDAGCKVARVEQTETPNDMQERKKAMGKGQKKPTVVSREVCSVVTKGTRTFCYLEDVSLLEKGEVTTGPLVVVKEIMVDSSGADDVEAGTRAVCEYGVTIVDAVTGVVTLGQFADDVLRSRMQTLLASFSPSEVSERAVEDVRLYPRTLNLTIHYISTPAGFVRRRRKWSIQDVNQLPQDGLFSQYCY
jgi:DNA mismatch repair protein MSH6